MTEQTFSYNFHNLLSETSFSRSNGQKQTTQFLYPFDIQSESLSYFPGLMTEKHILSDYIQKSTCLDNGRIIEGEYRHFMNVANGFKPIQINRLRKNNNAWTDSLYYRDDNSIEASYHPTEGIVDDYFGILADNYARVNIEFNYAPNPVYQNSGDYLTLTVNQRYLNPKPPYNWVYIPFETAETHNLTGYQCTTNIPGGPTKCTKTIELPVGSYEVKIRSHYGDPSSIVYDPARAMSGDCSLSFIEYYNTLEEAGILRPEVYYKYDSRGNVLEYRQEGNALPIVYLWGYKHQYPIAKIENAGYESVKNALNYTESQVETLAGKTEPSTSEWTAINNLRTLLPNARVTTYTYKPLVGLLTETDPRGVTVTYIYDAFNRLEYVKDENGKPLENYQYHYQNNN
jgi:YD repeat-containing protein